MGELPICILILSTFRFSSISMLPLVCACVLMLQSKLELGTLIHFEMATSVGSQGCGVPGKLPDVKLFNPTQLVGFHTIHSTSFHIAICMSSLVIHVMW
jgi:hypothetical protein